MMPVWACSSSAHASSSPNRTPMSRCLSSNGPYAVGPVGLAQAPLLDLAVGQPGQSVDEVDAAGALEARDARTAVLDQGIGERGARFDAVHRLDDRLHR